MLEISEDKVLELIKLGKQCRQTEMRRRLSVPFGNEDGLCTMDDIQEQMEDEEKIPSLTQENYERKIYVLTKTELRDFLTLMWLGRTGIGNDFLTEEDIANNFIALFEQAKRDSKNVDINYVLNKDPQVMSEYLNRGMLLFSVARRKMDEKKAG